MTLQGQAANKFFCVFLGLEAYFNFAFLTLTLAALGRSERIIQIQTALTLRHFAAELLRLIKEFLRIAASSRNIYSVFFNERFGFSCRYAV